MKLLIAGGGTGGHLFPGIALAEEVMTRAPDNQVVFVGTQRGLEAKVVPAAGYPLETISARGLKGIGGMRLLAALVALPVAFVEAWAILRRQRPDVVVGVGGYSSGPVVLAAWLMRIPTCIQEQNALPGFTNKVLGKIARVVFIAFDAARPFFPAGKVQLIGNPIRRKLMDNYLRSRTAHDRFSVLVFGGSLGAHGLNTRVIESLAFLGDLRDGLDFVHQTGKRDLETVRAGYAQHGFVAQVVEFIDDMSAAYAQAALVVCRAGATTLAELTVCKKASVLVPFPFATDNHQEVNAASMVQGGAALMFREAELTGEKLAETIRALKADGPRLQKMEKQAGILGRPAAAKELADVCMELMTNTYGPGGRARTAHPREPRA